MKLFTRISLFAMTAIALLGSQPVFVSSQPTNSTSPKTEPSPHKGFSVKNMDLSISPKDDFYHFAVTKIDALSSKEDLITLMATQGFMGIPSVFGIFVMPDKKQSNINALYNGSVLPLGKDFYENSDYSSQRKAYLAHIAKMLELAGETPNNAQTQAQTIFELETALAKGMLSPIEATDVNRTYNKIRK